MAIGPQRREGISLGVPWTLGEHWKKRCRVRKTLLKCHLAGTSWEPHWPFFNLSFFICKMERRVLHPIYLELQIDCGELREPNVGEFRLGLELAIPLTSVY